MDLTLQQLTVMAFLIVLALLPVAPAQAKGENGMYAVHGVSVDATAESAGAARDRAIAEGARKGLEKLLQQLTLPEDAKSLPAVTDKIAAPLVQDFEVESERTSAVRYIATLGFHYRPDGVRALLHEANVRFVESRAPLLLVIPVYRAATGDLLWEPSNGWRLAWKGAAARAALVPVVVPQGSPEDVAAISTADLKDDSKMQEFADHYKAGGSVVIYASAAAQNGDPTQGMQVTLSGGGGTDNDSFHTDGAPTGAEALTKAMTATLDHLDMLWKRQVLQGTPGPVAFKGASASAPDEAPASAPPGGPAKGYAVRVSFSGPGDLAALRARLAQIGLQRVELKSLSREQAIIVLGFAGTEDQLRQTVKDSQLTLQPPVAVPAGDSELAALVPASGSGAGLIYPLIVGSSP